MYFQQNIVEWMSIPVVPNLIPYVIMYNVQYIRVSTVLWKAVVSVAVTCVRHKHVLQFTITIAHFPMYSLTFYRPFKAS